MRCLTLADALRARGAHTYFLSRHLPEYLCSELAKNGHEVLLLDTVENLMATDELVHGSWRGVSQAQDAADSLQALSDKQWDWLVVDHYALDSRWEALLRHAATKILVIDDIADRQHDCDVLLDQNLYADMETRYVGKVPAGCRMLLGPHYSLLRDEFGRLREQVKTRIGPVRRLLVFFGGVDVNNYTGYVIEALLQIKITDLHVDVVIGMQHPFRTHIEAACIQHGFFCHVQTDNMAELMAAADMSIGAGGVATWERCCLGLPTLALCTADNQQRQVEDAARRGLLYSPEITGDLTQSIGRHILALIENGYLRQLISRNGMQTVDEYGVSRLLASMECDDVEVRVATLDDSEKLFNWRNHPRIREMSRNTGVISSLDHKQWFSAVLADSRRLLLIGENAGSPIGVVRFDVKNGEAEVSIYLTPEKASSGLGWNLLRSAESWLMVNYPDVRKIRAGVLGANERSLRFFVKAGYKIESADYSKRLH
jgi:UDP-2,4-diacetamido-2,4,6-trideoxy-beta-L-altropyranose hydrolase